ncbi:hypothetical protein [Pedobacter lusitanus]|nr:hypothetical protein [Pedobacter lusitanus]
MKRKILDIKDDIEKLIMHYCEEKFWIEWYGAYDIDPKHLVFWICIQSDEMKLNLKVNSELINKLRNILIKNNYPEQARQYVSIDFESQETVNRESAGNWYQHFK